jgi:hypothetical protein
VGGAGCTTLTCHRLLLIAADDATAKDVVLPTMLCLNTGESDARVIAQPGLWDGQGCSACCLLTYRARRMSSRGGPPTE